LVADFLDFGNPFRHHYFFRSDRRNLVKIVQPSVSLHTPFGVLTEFQGIEMLRWIEFNARISHRSEEAQTEDSWQRFIKAVVLEHGDWSVTEHASLTAILRVDRGVTHELVRHRLFCLDGDSQLHFDLPSGQNKGKSRRKYTVKLSKLYKNWSVGEQIPSRWSGKTIVIPQRNRLKAMQLRSCNEDTGEIGNTSISNIVYSGKKPVFKVILDNGYFIVMTANERIFTSDGWKTLQETTKLNLIGTTVKWDKNCPAMAVNGTLVNASGNLRGMNLSEAGRKKLSGMRRGPKNTMWKGGVKTLRQQIGTWTTRISKEIHIRDGSCAICDSTGKRECHHIDPVWHNPDKAFDKENLISLCVKCHKRITRMNLELAFLEDHSNNFSLREFWIRHNVKLPHSPKKPKGKGNLLMRTWALIKDIKYLGIRNTYDVEVSGPYHNFIANGCVVHNSFTQESTRFVNYGKREMEFIEPSWPAREGDHNPLLHPWQTHCESAEIVYEHMLTLGANPQVARSVLPNSLAATISVTGNLRNWRWFFLARTSKETHPDFRRVTIPMLAEFKKKIPLLYDDVEPEARQIDNLKKAR
jgi:thymidylate synthase ThyX/5-methylcytosine-specific restriction endonuclease McrA